MAKATNQKQTNGSTLDFEAQLWAAADKMPAPLARGRAGFVMGMVQCPRILERRRDSQRLMTDVRKKILTTTINTPKQWHCFHN